MYSMSRSISAIGTTACTQRARIIEPVRATAPRRAVESGSESSLAAVRAPPALASGCCCLAGGLPAAAAQARIATARPRRELKALKAEIERVAAQVSRDQVERDRLARELRDRRAVRRATCARASSSVRKERAEHAAQARAPSPRRSASAKRTSPGSASPSPGQLRAAYLIGSEEPLKLLLNQKDPARAGRMFAYYSYFGRARAEQIDAHHRARSRASSSSTASWKRRTSGSPRSKPSAARSSRGWTARARSAAQVLASLQTESRSRAQSLERMKRQQSGLEKLLRELKRAMEQFPVGHATPRSAACAASSPGR